MLPSNPSAPVFWKKVDENQISYLMYNNNIIYTEFCKYIWLL